jgi:hypothetical protein
MDGAEREEFWDSLDRAKLCVPKRMCESLAEYRQVLQSLPLPDLQDRQWLSELLTDLPKHWQSQKRIQATI